MKRARGLNAILVAFSLNVVATRPAATGELDDAKLTMWVAQASATLSKQPADAFEKKTGAKVELVVVHDPYESNIPTRLAIGRKAGDPTFAPWAAK